MAGYVRFAISAGEIGNTIGISSRRVYTVGNVKLYCVELFNGLELMVTSRDKRVGAAEGWFDQKLTIFDKPYKVSYKGNSFALLFTVFSSGKEHYTFSVESVSSYGRERFGVVHLRKGQAIIVDNEPTTNKFCQRLKTKALMFGE